MIVIRLTIQKKAAILPTGKWLTGSSIGFKGPETFT
jgi:hypothetical protein